MVLGKAVPCVVTATITFALRGTGGALGSLDGSPGAHSNVTFNCGVAAASIVALVCVNETGCDTSFGVHVVFTRFSWDAERIRALVAGSRLAVGIVELCQRGRLEIRER